MSYFKYKKPSLGCGGISKISDPLNQKYLIHHFYPEEPEPDMTGLSDEQRECLSKWATQFYKTPLSKIVTPLSKIKGNTEKTILLKRLLHIGMEKIKNHIQPVSVSELKNTAKNDPSGFETGINPEFRNSTLTPIDINISKIKGNSPEEGISISEPTVEEFLEDPNSYIKWQIKLGRLDKKSKKGGSTRRKKSRGRKTRKYL